MGWSSLNPKQRKYLKAADRINKVCEYLYAYNNELKEKPGIYFLIRDGEPRQDGSVQRYIYIGQAKNVITRIAQHIVKFEQRIDISLKNRGLFYEHTNPYGWKIDVRYCDLEELDEKERYYIAKAQEKKLTLYNITSGGQNEGKTLINERSASRGYKDGYMAGKIAKFKEIKDYFDKYLVCSIVDKQEVYKKDGSVKEIYIKKLKEFNDLLKETQK